jgi:hypothetical protein
MINSRTRTRISIAVSLAIIAGLIAAGAWYWREGRPIPAPPASNETVSAGSSMLEEMNLAIAPDQIESYKQAALRGDNEAAGFLAGHYFQAGQRDEEAKWLRLGANRGHCASMSHLKANLEDAGDHRRAAYWNDQLRRHRCTFGRTYPLVSDPHLDSTPLWNEN